MILRVVRVEDFAVLRGPVEVRLGPGLNVVHGENETGKTTLLRAVRAALTLRSRTTGKPLDEITPRDGSAPTVRVEFERDGRRWELEKEFRKQSGKTWLLARALAGGVEEEHRGDEAEERLRELLGVELPGRGAPRPEHLGVWPLVWVEQGESGLAPSVHLNDRSRSGLAERLARETGVVLGGAGAERILERARVAYERYWTSGGKEKRGDSPLFLARARLEAAEETLAAIEAERRRHEDAIREFSRLGPRLESVTEQLPKLERSREEAEARRARIESARRELEVAESQRVIAEERVQRLESASVERRRLAEAIVRARGEAERLEAERAALVEEVEEQKKARAELEEAERAARARSDRAARDLGALDAERDVLRGRERLAELHQRLDEARKRAAVIRELEALRGRLGLSDEDVAALRELDERASKAEARLDAAAATVRIEALAPLELGFESGRDAQDRVTLAPSEVDERGITDRTVIELGDVARVVVTPGGAELRELRDQLEAGRRELGEALDRAGVATLGEAEEQVRERARVESDLASERRLLAAHAKEGLDALETEVARVRGALDAALERWRREREAEPGDEPGPRPLEEVEAEVRGTSRAATELREELDELRRGREAMDRLREELLDRRRRLDSALEASRGAIDRDEKQVERSTAELGDDDRLREETESAKAALRDARKAESELREQLRELSPEDAEDAARRASAALEQARSERETLSSDLHRLEGELAASRAHGLHERLEGARAEREVAEDEVRREEREARATKLLHDTLVACRNTTRERFLEPLRDSVGELLAAFDPSASVTFAEGFEIDGLSREVGRDAFERLSGGAREQFGIVVRLAMARVLAGEGSLPVLLDDAFAWTDDERFDRFAAVLGRAARDLQVVLTTCHWERYRRLGVPPGQVTDLSRLVREARRDER